MPYTPNPSQSSTPATLSTLLDKKNFLVAVYADPRLKPCDKLILSVLVLAFHNCASGLCFPSIASIVDATRLSKRHVIYSLKRLRRCGYLLVLHNRGLSNHYRLVHPSALPLCTGVHTNKEREQGKKEVISKEEEERGVFA